MQSQTTLNHTFRKDLMASLVVFLIAVPLSLGIALASGAPPMSALVAAIVGGILVGAVSGAPLVVTGPAAGLSAMALQYIQNFGLPTFFQITVMAGIIQMLLALVKSARLIQKIPKSVVEGVLSAIGFIIAVGQLHILLGQKIPGSPVKNILEIPGAIARVFAFQENPVPLQALIVGGVTIATVLLWKRFATKLAWLPGALPAVILGTLVSFAFTVPLMELSPMGEYLQSAFAHSITAEFWTTMLPYFVPAFGLALVASAESLLTARSLDVLASKRHAHPECNVDRELMAQGMGNMVSAALGGLPVTGVMVRSAANLDAGAVTRHSTMLHGFWVGLFVMCAPQVLAKIPLAALAAILMLTGFKLINLKHMIQGVKAHPATGWIWPATACAVVATDLLKGLGIGLVLALIVHLIPKEKTHA